MFIVIVVVLIALAGVGALIGTRVTSVDKVRRSLLASGVAALILAPIVWVVGMITTVGANQVGVVTEFGRYQGTIAPGLHFLAPWSDVEEFGTRIQPLEMQDVGVRFDGNSGGTADLLVEWRIEATDEPAVRKLWSDYRTFDAVQNRVVQSNARNSLNVVLAGYTPSTGVAGTSLQTITDATLTGVKTTLAGSGVIVERITIRQIDPDTQSQDRINRQVQAQADLERTETTKRIAEQEAAIAAIRQGSQTPSSLQYECLRIASDWEQNKQGPLPVTWDCNFGGPGAPVIVGR